MKAALVDNGSLEPAAHRALRRAAAAIATRAGVDLEAVSWKHSDRIGAGALDGLAGQTLGCWLRKHLAEGEREFVLVPFIVSPAGAIASAIRAEAEGVGRGVEGFRLMFAGNLAGALPAIIVARIREALASRRIRRRPAFVVVDHGGPSVSSAALRDAVAAEARQRLGIDADAFSPASMESPGDGSEFSFNRPLLAEVLDRPGFDHGDVVIAPLFLSPGRHAGPEGDLGRIARAAEKRHPGLRCHFTALVGDHPLALETLAKAFRTALPVPLLIMIPIPFSESTPKPLSKNESLKAESHFLRGNIIRDLEDAASGTVSEESAQLTKFHGIYAQDDRDLRSQRRKEGKEKAFIFMARIRVPGGTCTTAQWLAMDAIADSHGNGTLKLTNRQAFQLHGIIKGKLRPAIREVNRALLDTLAACGDVNRNVMCNPNPMQSHLHAETLEIARAISRHLSPRTRAYHEIWVDDTLVAGGEPDEEPILGKTYLPRKFKTVIAVPPSNDVDVYAHDLGFIAIADEAGRLAGFNVTVGGGMGMTHNQLETYPRLADVMGFCRPDQVVDVAEKVVTAQRDYGDRSDRKHARLKYTIADRGLVWFRTEVERRLGYELGSPRRFEFTDTGDRYGWVDGIKGTSHFTLFIENGRVKDDERDRTKTALREIAKIHKGDFRLTPNQHLMIAGVTAAERPRIETLLREHGLDRANGASVLRRNSMACVALPTCGLALAESERSLPGLITALEAEVDEAGLGGDAIVIRMTGCPNGCGRPYLAEIGLVGRAPGKYNLYLGAAFNGSRLNSLYKASVPHESIVPLLRPIIRSYAERRLAGERFGDFAIRAGYVKPSGESTDFHVEPDFAATAESP